MKKKYIVTFLISVLVISLSFTIQYVVNLVRSGEKNDRIVNVGIVYTGDASAAYAENFMKAIKLIENTYGESVRIFEKFNIPEGSEREPFQDLIDSGCDIIFSISYGYGDTVKELAGENPGIEFCQATCSNANTEPFYPNYHTFMAHIYEGRYVSGVAAGMKLRDMIDNGEITSDMAKVGYIGAFPYAEVISGYTSFFLGIRSVVPEATMELIYTNTWSSYSLEKKAAERLVDDGCIVISQHSDTRGAAVVCERTDPSTKIFHVGYNQSMSDVAPTTSLICSRIKWEKYMLSAVKAIFENRKIEDTVKGNVHGNDVGGGFAEGWIEVFDINDIIAAPGTGEKINEQIELIKKGKIKIFSGDYVGVDPFDQTDVYDLNAGYVENEFSSAPTFHYILKDVIKVVE